MSGKRICLSLEERVRVIEARDKGMSERKLAELFKCGKTQINGILKSRCDILNEWQDNRNPGVKRKRHEKYEVINSAVFEWFKFRRSKNMPITGTLIKAKALLIASKLGVEDFAASNGWLERFRVRHTITFRENRGECGDVSDEPCCDWKVRLPSIIKNQSRQHVFNMDESGLFFRTLPCKSLTLKGEQCKGGKMAKERLTVCFCVSADGEKETPLVIGKSLRPSYFKNVDTTKLEVFWHANTKAWMTSTIFEDWLRGFDRRMKQQNRNVLLFLNNAPCHTHKIKLDNVHIQFFPPNTTAPLDQGIIQAFKLMYRKRMMQHLITRIDEAATVSILTKGITVSDALSWVFSAWKDVDCRIIVRCFQLCGFFDAVNDDIEEMSLDDMEALAQTAWFEFNQKLSEEESQADCYDDLSNDVEDTILFDAAGTNVKEDVTDSVESDEEPSLTVRETLSLIEKCHDSLKSADYINGEKINKLFTELRDVLENEITEQKCGGLKQTSL